MEADVINSLMNGVHSGDFKIDQLSAAIIPKSNYVMEGENYEADVMLITRNSSTQPSIILNGSALNNIENGVGKINLSATGIGEKSVSGTIKVVNPKINELESYPYQQNYQVFKPVATVSADKLNLLYVGLDNPLSISVPGFSAADISVTSSSLARISGGNGSYNVKVDGTNKTINVIVKADGRNMGVTKFRVRNVPKPNAKAGGVPNNGIAERASELCAQNRLFATLGADFA